MDDIRQRFLTDRVLTATPAQRVVMLYDRLVLDLARARTDAAAAGQHLAHANLIVAELIGSLDPSVGGPVDNLSAIYGFVLREILRAQISGNHEALGRVEFIVGALRETWVAVAEGSGRDAAGTLPALTAITA